MYKNRAAARKYRPEKVIDVLDSEEEAGEDEDVKLPPDYTTLTLEESTELLAKLERSKEKLIKKVIRKRVHEETMIRLHAPQGMARCNPYPHMPQDPNVAHRPLQECTECLSVMIGERYGYPILLTRGRKCPVLTDPYCEGCARLYRNVGSKNDKDILTAWLFYGILPVREPRRPADRCIMGSMRARSRRMARRNNFEAPKDLVPTPKRLFDLVVNKNNLRCQFTGFNLYFQFDGFPRQLEFASHTLDHVQPLSTHTHHLKHHIRNILPVCSILNEVKSNLQHVDFMAWWIRFKENRIKRGLLPSHPKHYHTTSTTVLDL
ncbi:hypothetical protein BDB01DRAFT_803773 [Pilobolus umbonatus]|nr:hypothetical protein BDB01DRAFT_803773 [Pilobolus umbonatus]